MLRYRTDEGTGLVLLMMMPGSDLTFLEYMGPHTRRIAVGGAAPPVYPAVLANAQAGVGAAGVAAMAAPALAALPYSLSG